eukprot:1270910-Amorphochlora_amoeboformis.AAC.1
MSSLVCWGVKSMCYHLLVSRISSVSQPYLVGLYLHRVSLDSPSSKAMLLCEIDNGSRADSVCVGEGVAALEIVMILVAAATYLSGALTMYFEKVELRILSVCCII